MKLTEKQINAWLFPSRGRHWRATSSTTEANSFILKRLRRRLAPPNPNRKSATDFVLYVYQLVRAQLLLEIELMCMYLPLANSR